MVQTSSHSGMFNFITPRSLSSSCFQIIPETWIIAYMPKFQPQYGFVIEFDSYGKIIKSYQDPKGKAVNFISEAVESDGHLYLGSFKDNYIASVKI